MRKEKFSRCFEWNKFEGKGCRGRGIWHLDVARSARGQRCADRIAIITKAKQFAMHFLKTQMTPTRVTNSIHLPVCLCHDESSFTMISCTQLHKNPTRSSGGLPMVTSPTFLPVELCGRISTKFDMYMHVQECDIVLDGPAHRHFAELLAGKESNAQDQVCMFKNIWYCRSFLFLVRCLFMNSELDAALHAQI